MTKNIHVVDFKDPNWQSLVDAAAESGKHIIYPGVPADLSGTQEAVYDRLSADMPQVLDALAHYMEHNEP